MLLILFTLQNLLIQTKEFNININPLRQQFKPLIVDHNTINLTITENPYILITFISPYCRYSHQFIENELQTLFEEAENYNIVFALYDVGTFIMRENNILDTYGIKETPTLIFFKNEMPQMYFGNRKSHNVMKWFEYFFNGNPGPIEILSEQQLQQFQEDNNYVLFYQKNSTQDNNKNYQKFYQYALQNQDLEITFAYSKQQLKNNSKSLYFYKKETQEKTYFSQQFTSENLKRFILKNKLPTIPKLNSETEELVFQPNSLSIILFNGQDESSKSVEQAFEETALLFKDIYQFSKINIQDTQFLEYQIDLGVNDEIIPKIVALNGKLKYKYVGPGFSSNDIKLFIFDLRQGKVDSYTSSEPIPDYNSINSYVKKIVGLNYDQVVKQSNKNVLLKYHIRDCQSCEELNKIYEELANNYRDNQNLVIAEIDVRLNDFSDIYYPRQIPDIILFVQNKKQRRAIFWNNSEMTIENIEKFIENNVKQEQK